MVGTLLFIYILSKKRLTPLTGQMRIGMPVCLQDTDTDHGHWNGYAHVIFDVGQIP